MDFVQTMKDWRRMCEHCDRKEKIGCVVNGSVCAGFCKMKDEIDLEAVEAKVTAWAAEHPESVYPTWGEWLEAEGVCFSRLKNYSSEAGFSIPQVFEYQIDGKTAFICGDKVNTPIPADIAEKLGIEPKE